jgi:hypothetical protein
MAFVSTVQAVASAYASTHVSSVEPRRVPRRAPDLGQRPSPFACRRALQHIPTRHAKRRAVTQAALSSGVGVSDLTDTAAAVAEAVSAARDALGAGRPPTLAVVSATAHRDLDEVARLFHEELKGVPSVGATSCTSVLTVEGPVERGISALLLAADTGSFATASASMTGDSPEAAYEAGWAAARTLKEATANNGGAKAVYMAATPGHEEHVLRAIHDVLGTALPVVGGSAADNDATGNWAVFHSGIAHKTGVSLFSIAADVSVGAAMLTPYKETTRSAVVTETNGRKIVKLDGLPAVDVISSFVGDAIESMYKEGGMIIRQTSTFPMALRRLGSDQTIHHISAHAAFIHQPEGSVSFFAEAKVGDTLIAMENTDGRCSAGAAGWAIRSAFEAAKKNGGLRHPSCCMLVYCGGLAIAVGDALADNMRDDFADIAPKSAIGLMAYGEQGPLRSNLGDYSSNHHCNLAVSMLLLE